jgi:hypothetical protein
MKICLKFVGSYPMVEPLLEPLFIYFDHEIFHFCPCLSVTLIVCPCCKRDHRTSQGSRSNSQVDAARADHSVLHT